MANQENEMMIKQQKMDEFSQLITTNEGMEEFTRSLDAVLNHDAKQAERYTKSWFGFGDITDEQKQELEQTKETAWMLEFALNDERLKLDETKRAKLKMYHGRQMSHLLLNNFRYKSDSKEMDKVKESIRSLEGLLSHRVNVQVSDELVNGQKGYYNNAADKQLANIAQSCMGPLAEYQKAINACKAYLDAKHSNYEKGRERKRLVRANMERMLEEMSALALGVQMVRRGRITRFETLGELLQKSMEFMRTSAEITPEEAKKAVGQKERNFSPNHLFREVLYMEQVKKINPECKGVLFTILEMSNPSELFHPDKTGKLPEEEKKLKKCMVSMSEELHKFPKNCFYSKSFAVGNDCFTLIQTENNDLIMHYDQQVFTIQKTAQGIADSIADTVCANSKVFSKSDMRRVSAWMRDETLDTGDLETRLRIDNLSKRMLGTRLRMRPTDLANIHVLDLRRIANELTTGTIGITEARSQIKAIETMKKERKTGKQKLSEELAGLDKMEHQIREEQDAISKNRKGAEKRLERIYKPIRERIQAEKSEFIIPQEENADQEAVRRAAAELEKREAYYKAIDVRRAAFVLYDGIKTAPLAEEEKRDGVKAGSYSPEKLETMLSLAETEFFSQENRVMREMRELQKRIDDQAETISVVRDSMQKVDQDDPMAEAVMQKLQLTLEKAEASRKEFERQKEDRLKNDREYSAAKKEYETWQARIERAKMRVESARLAAKTAEENVDKTVDSLMSAFMTEEEAAVVAKIKSDMLAEEERLNEKLEKDQEEYEQAGGTERLFEVKEDLEYLVEKGVSLT